MADKQVDVTSTLVAGAMGALLVAILANILNTCAGSTNQTNTFNYVVLGFLTGAGVQIGLRLFGVS